MREAVHPEPVWRDRSNFVIGAAIDSAGSGVVSEQLWARKINETKFEICCIPFFVYDLSLGDVVEVFPDYNLRGVVRRSGRFVFRVKFNDPPGPAQEFFVQALRSSGFLVERSSVSMVAVDAKDLRHAEELAGWLEREEAAGRIVYETGRLS